MFRETRRPCWRPSWFLARWLSWCMVRFCYECGLSFVSISWFWDIFYVICDTFGVHLGFIWDPFGRHWASKWSSKTTWGLKWSRKAPRSENSWFSNIDGGGPRILTPNLIIFRPCTKIIWLFRMWFAVAISLRFSMDSWTPGRLKIMQNHWRVSQSQGFTHSEKERFKVTI
jgi:hypothetical protein